uniref:Transcriptional regulator HTH-type FeoC domain-containing protein n=1 Tax=candidate division WOR-3 bacterium TaxID=2052148 RepID=A0A7C3N9I2_UNCW3
MIEEIIDYILKKKVVSTKELTKRFNIDEPFLDYIISYAKNKGYGIKKDKNKLLKCSFCPYKKFF